MSGILTFILNIFQHPSHGKLVSLGSCIPFNTHFMGTRALLPSFPLLWPLLPHLFFRLGISMG